MRIESFIGLFFSAPLWSPGVACATESESATVTLVNEHIEIGVDPAHGLILGFGLPGKENLLWVNPHPLSSARHSGWVNYGGDKLWWGPFLDWLPVKGRHFPPDEALDGAWKIISRESGRVVMQSAVSPWTGSKAEREIVLDPKRPAVAIHNRFIRETASTQRLQLWTVCQIPPPRWVWLDSQPATGEPAYINLRPDVWAAESYVKNEPELGCVRGLPSPGGNFMIGTRGAWIAAVYDQMILVHIVAPYPEPEYSERVSLQLFSDAAYVELETLSGVANPGPGETMSNTVYWRLLARPENLSDAELNRWLRAELANDVAR
jgi:hypothetical protein